MMLPLADLTDDLARTRVHVEQAVVSCGVSKAWVARYNEIPPLYRTPGKSLWRGGCIVIKFECCGGDATAKMLKNAVASRSECLVEMLK